MRENNFDIVRLVLASIVVLVHSENLSHSEALAWIPRVLSSHMAVEGFFAISGFLIFASYERCASLGEYFKNRAWRILPGYWLSTAFCLLIAFSLGHFHVGKFLAANLLFVSFLHGNIEGVFDSNPENNAMNGALWTIKIEVMFYVAVPLIVWLGRRWRRGVVLGGLLALSVAYRMLLAGHAKLVVQLPGQLSFFMVGALIYYHLPFFKRQGRWLMLGAAAVYAVHLATGFYPLRPIGVAGLTIGACLLLPQVKGPTRWGDFSYGTYILHYPIVQCVVAAGLFAVHPWGALGLVIGLVIAGAGLSWFFVEKPSLAHAKSRKLRQAALGLTGSYPAAVP